LFGFFPILQGVRLFFVRINRLCYNLQTSGTDAVWLSALDKDYEKNLHLTGTFMCALKDVVDDETHNRILECLGSKGKDTPESKVVKDSLASQ
jgi:hypothetical protein